jgi:hypothetical protein
MKKAIAYALFGYGQEKHKDCFDFNSYLRSMHICLRFNRILYPGWQMVVNIDHQTWSSPYRPIFEWHQSKGFIRFELQDNGPLCRNMLWRLKTVFDYDHPDWRYTHVICRDLDSISTYREAQMVQEWINEDKAVHCITDSISHTIPMMGGLVGFRPGYLNDILKLNINPEAAWDKLLQYAPDLDFKRKGSDQDFLNRVIYPLVGNSVTEHFIKGMRENIAEANGRHYKVDETIDIGVDPKFKETNLLAGHAGSAGFYETPTMKFLYWDDPFKKDYEELETMKGFEQIFYWNTREDLR